MPPRRPPHAGSALVYIVHWHSHTRTQHDWLSLSCGRQSSFECKVHTWNLDFSSFVSFFHRKINEIDKNVNFVNGMECVCARVPAKGFANVTRRCTIKRIIIIFRTNGKWLMKVHTRTHIRFDLIHFHWLWVSSSHNSKANGKGKAEGMMMVETMVMVVVVAHHKWMEIAKRKLISIAHARKFAFKVHWMRHEAHVKSTERNARSVGRVACSSRA